MPIGELVVKVDVDKIEWPDELEIKDPEELYRLFGNAIAKVVRDKLKAGATLSGAALPPGWTLKDTGKLIRQISYNAREKSVMPFTKRRSDVSRKAYSSFGLLQILIELSKQKTGSYLDVFGDRWSDRPKLLAEILQGVVNKLLEEKKIGLTKSGTGGSRKSQL